MNEIDSNFNFLKCPFCNSLLKDDKDISLEIEDVLVYGDEEDFFRCRKCNNFIRIDMEVIREYEYSVRKPTKEEIQKENLQMGRDLPEDNDVVCKIEDIPGQLKMWD